MQLLFKLITTTVVLLLLFAINQQTIVFGQTITLQPSITITATPAVTKVPTLACVPLPACPPTCGRLNTTINWCLPKIQTSVTPPTGCYFAPDYKKCPLVNCPSNANCHCPHIILICSQNATPNVTSNVTPTQTTRHNCGTNGHGLGIGNFNPKDNKIINCDEAQASPTGTVSATPVVSVPVRISQPFINRLINFIKHMFGMN